MSYGAYIEPAGTVGSGECRGEESSELRPNTKVRLAQSRAQMAP